MRPVRLPLLLEIAVLAGWPCLAWADNLGATRIPSQVEEVKNASADAPDPGTLDTDTDGTASSRRASKQVESKTLGGNAPDPSARRIENTADGLTAPGSLYGQDPSAPSADGGEKVTTGQPSSGIPELHVV